MSGPASNDGVINLRGIIRGNKLMSILDHEGKELGTPVTAKKDLTGRSMVSGVGVSFPASQSYSNTIVIAGDSLAANNSATPTNVISAVQSAGAFSLANALGGNRFSVIAKTAVGGKMASEMLTEQVPVIIALAPKYCYFSIGINDIFVLGAGSGAVVAARVIAIVDALIAAGITPIWSTLWATSSATISRPDHIWCNDLLRQYAATNKCGIFFDGFKISQLPGQSTLAIRSLWTLDSAPPIHVNNLGAYWLGKAMWKAFDAFVPECNTLASGAEDQTNSTNNKSNLLVNPFFSGTGGTVSANCAGEMPDNWVIDWATRTGTGIATTSIVDVLDKNTGLVIAKGIKVTISGTPAAGDIVRVSQPAGFNALLSGGDRYLCQGVVSLVNPTYMQQVTVRTLTNNAEACWAGANTAGLTGSGTYEAYPETCTLTYESQIMTVSGSGVSSAARYDMRVTFNGAATGNIVLSQPRVRKI